MLSGLLTIVSPLLLGMIFVASLFLVMLDFSAAVVHVRVRLLWSLAESCGCRTGVTCSGSSMSTCINIISVGPACQWTFIADGSELLKRIDIIATDVLVRIFSCGW